MAAVGGFGSKLKSKVAGSNSRLGFIYFLKNENVSCHIITLEHDLKH